MSLPSEPYSRIERYLARLAGQEVDIPDKPITRIECYLDYIVNNGGGVPATNAGAHNAVFRGKNLGSTFTEAQADAIAAGTFEDIFVGDYWEIGSVKYLVAGLDLYLGMGNPAETRHHAVMTTDKSLYNQMMNSTASTSGGYSGSLMRSEGLASALDTIKQAFGETSILTHRSMVTTAVASGIPSNWGWVDSQIDIMTEGQVYGRGTWGTQSQNGYNIGEKYGRFPLFALDNSQVVINGWYWLQDVRGEQNFCRVAADGTANSLQANNRGGLRPYFFLGKAS